MNIFTVVNNSRINIEVKIQTGHLSQYFPGYVSLKINTGVSQFVLI